MRSLTISLPEVNVAGINDKNHEKSVPASPVDERTDAHLYGEPGAILAEHIYVGSKQGS